MIIGDNCDNPIFEEKNNNGLNTIYYLRVRIELGNLFQTSMETDSPWDKEFIYLVQLLMGPL